MHLARRRDDSDAKPPPGGYYEPPPGVQRRLATVAVDDPLAIKVAGKAPPKVLMRVNIERDVLAQERKAGRISEAAYKRGQAIQETLERGRPSGSGQWLEGDRVDAVAAHEHAIACNVDDANAALALRYHIRATIGRRMADVLCLVLGHGLNLEQTARAMRHGATARQRHYIAQLFRDALEDYTAAVDTAKGKGRPR